MSVENITPFERSRAIGENLYHPRAKIIFKKQNGPQIKYTTITGVNRIANKFP